MLAVRCSNCPGLTDAEIDRSTFPPRARIRAGQRTSVRAYAPEPCGTSEPQLQIERWSTGTPGVVAIEPSSPESAILIALAPGTTTLVAERRLPGGAVSRGGLRDTSGALVCVAFPELLVEVVP